MLSDALKQQIQQAYTQFLNNKGLKARYGQKLMIAEIAKTLGAIELDEQDARQSQGHVCVVEAGTGTGKTVAYLLPALVIAKALGKKLVISTATVALQEQIIHKDLPDLRQHSELSFNYALAKGRGRYLCLSKLDNLLIETQSGLDPNRALYEDERPQIDSQAVKLYESMAEALAANRWDGERDSWPGGLEPEQWQPVTTDHRQCTGRRCSNVSSCMFFRARESLDSMDCIVTNHDLVMADLALGGGAILPAPADAIYVFDEGHQLPAKALNHFSHHSRIISTGTWLNQCNKQLGTILGHIGEAGDIGRYGEELPAVLADCKQRVDQIYPALDALAQEVVLDPRQSHYRFPGGVIPEELMLMAVQLASGFEQLSRLLDKMLGELNRALEDPHCPVPKVDLENHYPVLGTWQARAEANRELWNSYALADRERSAPRARWLTPVQLGSSIDVEVCSSPILAARTLEQSLWQHCCGAVVTSATLAALGKFDGFRLRAGTPADSLYQQMPSPFDFSRATLHVPAQAVDAGDALAHTQALIDALPELLDPDEGSLVLFSSRRQMQDVYEQLPSEWRERILLQGAHSKQEMLSQHRKQVDAGEGSVLFGLASFSEGVDLPGDYCRHVVIAKLPFAVPDDPIEATLAEWIEAQGRNAFMEITVPDAALKLVQACGRLLRSETDRGKITLLDRRIVTKRYGNAILNSLPPFTRIIE